eukprot:1197148-Pyramimonas_sp.AAC.1
MEFSRLGRGNICFPLRPRGTIPQRASFYMPSSLQECKTNVHKRKIALCHANTYLPSFGLVFCDPV